MQPMLKVGVEAELRYNPNHDEKGRFAERNRLTEGNKNAKIKQIVSNDDGSITVNYKEEKPKTAKRTDKNGIPFKYDTVSLDPKEYKNVIDEIGRWYSLYENQPFCSCDFSTKSYLFENCGIGDYNIYEVIDWKKD